jgi:hypothetical protein
LQIVPLEDFCDTIAFGRTFVFEDAAEDGDEEAEDEDSSYCSESDGGGSLGSFAAGLLLLFATGPGGFWSWLRPYGQGKWMVGGKGRTTTMSWK